MASIDDWSDSEIRTKLAELGTPVGPVTETTRKTLIKKLKKLLQNSEGNAATSGRTRRSLSRFSSGDEDSQEDAPSMPPPSRTRSLRRRTVGPSDITSANDSATSAERESGTFSKTTKVTRKSTGGIATTTKEDFDSGSDSDVPTNPYESTVTGRRSLKADTPTSIPRTLPGTTAYGTPRPDTSSSRIFPGSASLSESTSTPSRTYSNFRSETTTTSTRQYVVPRSDPLAPSRFSTSRKEVDPGASSSGTSSYRDVPLSRTTFSSSLPPRSVDPSRSYEKISTDFRKTYRREEEEDEDEDADDSQPKSSPGFHSDFLSQLQARNRLSGSHKPMSTFSRNEPSSYVHSRTSISPSSANVQLFDKYRNIDFGSYRNKISSATKGFFSSKSNVDYPENVNAGDKTRWGKLCGRNMLYFVLAVLAILIAGAAYLAMGPNPLGLESDYNSYPICDAENRTQPCIESKHLQPALNLQKIIQPKLHEMAIEAYCNEELAASVKDSEVPVMSETAAVEYLMKKIKPTPKSFTVQEDLRHLKILTMANPHWDMKVVDETGAVVTDANTLVVTGGLAAQHVNYPIKCYVYRFAYGIARWVVISGIVVCVIALAIYSYRFFSKRREQHRRDVYGVVNKILAMLEENYEKDKQGYLAVDNCRDELIPPVHRDSMKTVWDAAVNFIEKHESRVRTELHNVRGENVKVWRWLPAKGPPISDGPKLDRLM